MKLSSLFILLITVVVNLLVWTVVNKPYHTVETHYPLNSFSWNPYKKHQTPFEGKPFAREELESDLKILSKKTRTVRLYSSLARLDQVPEIAKQFDMSVIASAYLDGRIENNRNIEEVMAAVQMAKTHKNVSNVIIGNETQLHKLIPREELVGYLDWARKKLKTPVSTAEPWDFWLIHPEMANHVDFIAIHVLPYWAEIPAEQAVQYVMDRYNVLKNAFPKKMIMIAETGWPSDGPQRGAAKATLANQADFVRRFMKEAEEKKVNYNIIEAFDQPWKSELEGRAGEHWGMMDADRHDKFPISGPVLEDPKWKYWALGSTILGFLASLLFLARRPDLTVKGQIFAILIFQSFAAFATQLAREASDQYMSPGDILFWAVMITAQVLLAIIFLTDAAEIADVVGNKNLRKRYLPAAPSSDPDRLPMVSIHLACCKEPPGMVIATLNSLAALDYPNFEVIVVDNNTDDPALWQPVQTRCRELGERFRFFTLGKWPGFKAGALNYALKKTNPEAAIVGVVDADYVVEKDWLKATVPYFVADPDVGIVQAPQEHRDWQDNPFQRMENDEYAGFFRIGMVQRNEHNAIIQHGTMTLIDRETLDKLKGWAEWCICEDAEMGLRILNLEKRAIYLNHPFGHGLVPNTYEAYAKQRFRWAYGAMRILKHHWATLWGVKGNLTFAQRYQFVKGWLPWLGDALHMLFTLTAIGWSVLLIARPLYTDFPEPIFIYPALLLVVLRIAGTLWTYSTRVKIGKKRTLMAMIAGGSLTHKIAKAVFQGLLTRSKPFYRTPKLETKAPLIKALASVFEELFLAAALIGLAVGIILTFGAVNDQALLWTIALVVQSFPYLAAIAAALVSGFSTTAAPNIPAVPAPEILIPNSTLAQTKG